MDGITKTLEFSGTKNMKARVTVTETYDITKNSSDLTVAVDLLSTGLYGFVYFLDGIVSIDNDPFVTLSSESGDDYVYINEQNIYCPISGVNGSPWKVSGIKHDPDGAKSVTVKFSVQGFTQDKKGAHGFVVEGSFVTSLTHIPRESTIGATDANIGSSSMIAVSRKNAAYTHSIRYTFVETSGYIKEDGTISAEEVKMDAASIPFAIPTSFYAQIPNKKSAVCTLVCKTYSGTTQIGESKSTTFVITAAESLNAPQVTGVVEDVNPTTLAITGNKNKFIRYYSDALCTIAATARNEATIKSKAIDGVSVSGSTRTINEMAKESVTFKAVDSRGYASEVSVSVDLIPYIPLTCVASGSRKNPTDGTAELTVKGNYYNGSLGGSSNTLTLQYKQGNGALVSVNPVISGNTYTATIPLTGLDYTKNFTFTVVAKDKVTTVTQNAEIGKGIPTFDWGENDFAFHVPVNMSDSLTVGGTTITGAQLARLIAMLG
jgi:hypothetical protein